MSGDEYDTSVVNFRVRNPLLEEFENWVGSSEYGNRSDALRGLMEEAIGNKDTKRHSEGQSDTHLPSDEREHDIYMASFKHSSDGLVLHERDLAIVAQETRVNTDSLKTFLLTLEKKGYVRRVDPPLWTKGGRLRWYIKPPGADPGQWKYRRQSG